MKWGLLAVPHFRVFHVCAIELYATSIVHEQAIFPGVYFIVSIVISTSTLKKKKVFSFFLKKKNSKK